MLIKEVTRADIPTWLAIAHESDEVIARLVPDLKVFYFGFDDYMARKIAQKEAFMAADVISKRCLGVIAFSRKNNRISFIGITEKTANFSGVGKNLLEFALNQLDAGREITTNVIDSSAGVFKKERELYRSFGFIATNDKIMENGVQAVVLKRTK